MSQEYQLPVKISLSDQYISKVLSTIIERYMEEWSLDVNGVDVLLKKNDDLMVKVIKNTLWLSLPLEINIKRPSGLFSVEANGKAVIHLHTPITFDANHRLNTELKLSHFDWIEKPSLQMGVLNIPVTTLIQLIMNHASSIITGRLDSALRNQVNLKDLLDTFVYDKILDIDLLKEWDLFADLQLTRIDIVNLQVPHDHTEWDVLITYRLSLSDRISEQRSYPIIYIHEDVSKRDRYFPAGLSVILSQGYCASLLETRAASQKIGNKRVLFENSKIDIKENIHVFTRMVEPVKMEVNHQFMLTYNELNGELTIDESNIEIRPGNIIYRFFTPLLRRMIEEKIKEVFPLHISDYLHPFLSKFPSVMKVENLDIAFHHLKFKVMELLIQDGQIVMVLNSPQFIIEVKEAIENLADKSEINS